MVGVVVGVAKGRASRACGERPAESGLARILAQLLAGTWNDCSDL